MTDHTIAVVTLIVSAVVLLLAALDRRDRYRYSEFLVRVHREAAQTEEAMRAIYGSSVYPVRVGEDELDLAFRAMAEEILFLEGGVWQCRPALLILKPPNSPDLP